jgi:hypothetical protein
MLIMGSVAGYLLKDQINIQQFGGIPLIVIFTVLLVGPMLFIKRKSRFETDKAVVATFDGIGTIQGLRGALFRVLIYEEGIEIRALYQI